MRRPMPRLKGFTLVELSIVLVIIGLIIGGVLTGPQIIQNARIANAINGLQAYQAQFQTYAQNYGAVAGDDAGAKGRFSASVLSLGTATVIGNGDGVIDAAETGLVWAHLRAAGLVKSQSPIDALPVNPFGGFYKFQNGAFTGASAFTTTVLCLGKLPAGAAGAIDARIDDGKPDSGTLEAAEESGTGMDTTAEPATGYADGKTYTLCAKL